LKPGAEAGAGAGAVAGAGAEAEIFDNLEPESQKMDRLRNTVRQTTVKRQNDLSDVQKYIRRQKSPLQQNPGLIFMVTLDILFCKKFL
jgi:hypothetical protein